MSTYTQALPVVAAARRVEGGKLGWDVLHVWTGQGN